MKVGDLVKWAGPTGPIGVVIELGIKRLYIPTAKVLIEGEVMEFDIEELWRFYESR